MEVKKEQKEKAIILYELCKGGKAPTIEIKHDLVKLYNEIHKTNYRLNTNCGSCLETVLIGIKAIAEK